MLASNIPDLEVHVVERDGSDVLADGWDGGFGGPTYGRAGIIVEGFNGGEESGFAGVVEAEEEDGIFCGERTFSEQIYHGGLEGERTS